VVRNKKVVLKEPGRKRQPRKESVEVRVFGFILIGYGLYFILS